MGGCVLVCDSGLWQIIDSLGLGLVGEVYGWLAVI